MSRITFAILILLITIGIVAVFPREQGEEADIVGSSVLFVPETVGSLEVREQPLVVDRTALVPSIEGEVNNLRVSEPGILISVLGSGEGEPVPGAEVLVLDNGVTDWLVAGGHDMPPVGGGELFSLFATRYTTNEIGQVMIDSPVGTMHIAARTNTHFGFRLNVGKDATIVTLSVNPITIVVVKVVDEEGGAVEGAPVSVRVTDSSPAFDIVRAVSDSEGLATLELSDLTKMEYFGRDLSVALLALVPSPIMEPLNLANLPEEPISLVLPETGQVKVKLRMDDRSSPSGLFFVDVVAVEEPTARSLNQGIKPSRANPHLVELTTDGSVSFPFIGFEQYLHVTAVSQDGELRFVGHGPGPTMGGGAVTISLFSEIQQPILVGRIVNTEGNPAKNLGFETNLRFVNGDDYWNNPGQLRTDEKGFFRVPFEHFYEPGCRLTFTIKMRATKRKPKRVAVVDLSRSLGSGEQGLGEIVLAVPPLLAQGTIVDESKNPVQGASVLFWRGDFSGGERDKLHWMADWELREETDSAGNFSIRGFVEDGHQKLSVEHDDYLGTERGFAVGEKGIQIELAKSMVLKGRFVLDDWVDSRMLRVTIHQSNSSGKHEARTHSGNLRADGGFQVTGLSEGPTTLALIDEHSNEELYSTGSFILSASGRRLTLDDIDLLGVLNSIRVIAVDESGSPLEDGWFRMITEKGHSRYRALPVDLITRRPGLDIEVGRIGRRSKSLYSISQSVEVELPNGIPVRLIVENPECIPEGWELIGALVATASETEDRGFFRRRSPRGGVLVEGNINLTVSSDGEYQSVFYLRRISDGFVHSVSPQISSSRNNVGFEIRDQIFTQDFQIMLLKDSLPDVE